MVRGPEDEVQRAAVSSTFSGGVPAPDSWPLSLTEHKCWPHSVPVCGEHCYPATQHREERQVGKDAEIHLPGYSSGLALLLNTGFLLEAPHSVKPLTLGCFGVVLTPEEMRTVDVCGQPEKS